MIWGVWWWVEGWKGNMEEGFLGRLSRRRMAGPIYIIILLLSPGDAKIDDADVKQVVVELNHWRWLWRLWQNSRVSIFWQPAVIIVLSAYPRIDEAKSLLAFIVLLILSLSLKLSVWISELFVNTAPWEKTRMIKEEIGRIANTYFEVLMCIKTKDTKQKTRMIKEEIWRIANIRVFWQFCKLSTVIASLSSSCRKGFIPNRKKKQSKRQVYY